MAELPSGTVTFVFVDLVGSTRQWEEHHEAMVEARTRYYAILDGAVARSHGVVFSYTGDGIAAAFASATDAVTAAVDAQRGLSREPWGETGPLTARMGLHTGEGTLVADDQYDSHTLNRCARLMGVAYGGQVLVSGSTAALLADAPIEGMDVLDLGEHRLRDLARPMHVYQVRAPGLVSEFAPLRSLDAFATNLPLQVTTFVGRDEDKAEVIDALAQSRVVTLIGVGGVGKTRLAVQVAAEVLPLYRDGVWLCELGPLSDPGQVPDVVAHTLGVQQRPGQSITESLVVALRYKELLVVLDNCEHLLDAAAQLVAIMVESCPGATVLATGREGLGVRGERMMMVRSLPLPGERATTDEILAADAVALFTERAQQAGGGLDLDAETVATVAQLCRRLDGIPLAIELAAARTRMMSPQEIAARLDERFRLLTGGSRTAVARHQTLRGAIDWSYDLLDARERAILDRLGVFSGGFTLDAAEAVVGGDDIDPRDVLDGIAKLVDKSLLVAERERHATRYRLLETIRSYALERLDARSATDTMRRRHATWCAGFMAQVSVGVKGPDEVAWLARLDREIDNVRAALTWATGADDGDLSLFLIGSFGFWNLFGRRLGYVLGPWAAAALATTGAAEHPQFAHVLALRALYHFNHQRIDEAERDARRAIDLIAEPATPFSTIPWSVLGLVLVYGRAEKVEGVDAFLEAARATGDDYTIADALTIGAASWYSLGSAERGLPCAEEAMLLAQRTGNPTLMAAAGSFLGGLLETTDPPRARAILETALEHGNAVGAAYVVATALRWVAQMGADPTSPQWAAHFRSGLDLVYEAGDSLFVLALLEIYAEALAATDRAETAAMLSASVAELAPHMSNPVSVAHRRITNERLVTRLDTERFAELTAHGATLGYDEAVSLALAEFDRVIADDDPA